MKTVVDTKTKFWPKVFLLKSFLSDIHNGILGVAGLIQLK